MTTDAPKRSGAKALAVMTSTLDITRVDDFVIVRVGKAVITVTINEFSRLIAFANSHEQKEKPKVAQ